jgi:hypothetical protein
MPRGRRPKHDRGAVRSELFRLHGENILVVEIAPRGRLNIIHFREDLSPADRERAAAWLASVIDDHTHEQAYDLLWG